MDHGRTSMADKIGGRECVTLHAEDAAARGIADGEVVRVFNDRGALLAVAALTHDIRGGVIKLPTGAWYDPATPGEIGVLEKHGNPNVLTPDRGTSRLAQGPSAHSALVEVERFVGAAPEVTAFAPPQVIARGA